MYHFAIGVLRVRFRDHAQYLPANWIDAGFDNVFLSRAHPLGVTNFWETHTLGHVEMSGSQVFPWLTIDLDLEPMLRGPIVEAAIRAAEAAHYNLDPFHGLVVFCVPDMPQAPFLDVGSTGASWGKRSGTVALLAERTTQSVMAHEVGHVLGLGHTFSANPWLETPKEYGDSTCVMGGGYAYTGQVDPSMGVDPAYFTAMGPGTSGATLVSYVSEVNSDARVEHWDNTAVQKQQRLRIYARDTHKGPLVHVIDWPDVPAKKYVLEYRRPAGFDWVVPHCVNVHTLMEVHQAGVDVSGNPWHVVIPDAPIWRTHIGLPFPFVGVGPVRWLDPQEDFAVRMEKIADDGEWVEVTVGSHALLAGKGTRLVGRRTESEQPWQLVGGGIGKEVRLPIPPGCGIDSFGFEEYRLPYGYTHVDLETWGFTKPVFAWWINGQRVPEGGWARKARVPGVMVQATIPSPGSETTRLQLLNLRAVAQKTLPKLVIFPDAADGNYMLSVVAKVAEASDPDNYLATVAVEVEIERWVIKMSHAYEAAVTACALKFEGVANQYAKSRPRGINPLGSIARNEAVLGQWAEAVQDAAPGLAGLFSATARAMRSASPLPEIQPLRTEAE